MSPTTWISALILGALPVLAHAEPLATFTASSGQISALEPGVFLMEAQGFHAFNVTATGGDQHFTPNDAARGPG